MLVDGRGAPTRIPPMFETVFRVPAGTLVLGRVALGDPPADAHRHGFTVRPQELDPMDHVNNAVYADWLDEAVIAAGDPAATGAIPRAMRLEYALAAEPGATPRGTGVVGRRWLVVPAGRRRGCGHAPGAARAAAGRAGGRPGRPLVPVAAGVDRAAKVAATRASGERHHQVGPQQERREGGRQVRERQHVRMEVDARGPRP